MQPAWEFLRKQIEIKKKKIKELNNQLLDLHLRCPCRDERNWAEVIIKARYERAECSVCGRDFDWWCPESPNHVCRYSESEDWCDFCGQPLERK